jgi:hypothetical protein
VATKIRQDADTFTVKVNDGREFTLRLFSIEEYSEAQRLKEGSEFLHLPTHLLEKCAVGPAITATDLADMTGEEMAELCEIVVDESITARAANGFVSN